MVSTVFDGWLVTDIVQGMLMTLSDANQIGDLSLVGPQGLLHRLACTRSYTYRFVC